MKKGEDKTLANTMESTQSLGKRIRTEETTPPLEIVSEGFSKIPPMPKRFRPISQHPQTISPATSPTIILDNDLLGPSAYEAKSNEVTSDFGNLGVSDDKGSLQSQSQTTPNSTFNHGSTSPFCALKSKNNTPSNSL